jgi:hypothetical protein
VLLHTVIAADGHENSSAKDTRGDDVASSPLVAAAIALPRSLRYRRNVTQTLAAEESSPSGVNAVSQKDTFAAALRGGRLLPISTAIRL